MPIQIPLPVLRGNPVQRITHIRAHVVIPVLVEGECATRVLHEEVEHADFVVADFGEFGDDVVGDEVGPARAGGEGELFLEPGHFCLVLWWLLVGVRSGEMLIFDLMVGLFGWWGGM